MNCIKNGQTTLFADILNEAIKDDLEGKDQRPLPKEHWFNQNVSNEDDKTLLMVAIDKNAEQNFNKDEESFIGILLRSGADPNLYNHDFNVTPLIYATKRKDLKAMRLLTQFGADVNATSFNTGQTSLHHANQMGFTVGVKFLLEQPNIDINVKDKKGKQTPLFLAIKAQDEESIRLLIAHGADLDHQIRSKSIREHLKTKLPHIEPNMIPKVKAGLARQTSQSTLEKLGK